MAPLASSTSIGWVGDPDASSATWLFPYRYPDVPVELIPSLYEHFPDAESGLMWAGWAGFLDEEIRGCARVRERDGLDYQVIAAIRAPEPRAVRSRTPNFWWPRDRSWCVATGIDDEHTLVAAADRSRLESVHADPRLETLLFPPRAEVGAN